MMFVMRTGCRHLSAAVVVLTTALTPAASITTVAPAQSSGLATFLVLVRGVRIGTETVDVAKTETGWLISATGSLRAPFDLVTTKFEMTYGNDWQPRHLSIEGLLGGQLLMLNTSFGVTTATSEAMQGGGRVTIPKQVSPRSVVLPTGYFSAYEALAARLGPSTVGTRFPVFIAPDGEISAVITRITPRRIILPTGPVELRQFDLTFNQSGGPVEAEIWVDGRNRLARLVLPAPGLSVIRDDLSTVMAREETIRNPGDADAFIPLTGFNLAATITRPASRAGRAPAVILVAGSGVQDRDENRFGVAIFGQLAGALADAGYLVVRFDKRGVGQSGGRAENATVATYGEDVVGIVNWLRRQKDVDPERIAVAGHGEGAAIAMTAAARERRIRAVAILAGPGRTGRDVTVEQQQLALARSDDSAAVKDAKMQLQLRINEAVVTGLGWDRVPPDLRRQAETPWFRSWLLFDPAATMSKIQQPVLIVHGALDRQIPPSNADLLEHAARARKRSTPADTQKLIAAGVNHLLVPAKTGEPDEYLALPSRTIDPAVPNAIASWLKAMKW
jgi:pimeloyl-ACP methyl ester carboxylesterase